MRPGKKFSSVLANFATYPLAWNPNLIDGYSVTFLIAMVPGSQFLIVLANALNTFPIADLVCDSVALSNSTKYFLAVCVALVLIIYYLLLQCP